MSNILIKKVQDTLIATPASNYIKLFSNSNDGGKLYYKDSSGVATPIDTQSDPLYVEVTYSQLYSLGASGSFVTASYYLITDFDSVYEQPDFYFDGTPKTVLDVKGKPAIPYQPILVMANSYNTLSPDATQPYFSKDKIKYDFTWNKTELNHNAKGRITERIDEFGNRTDYDHRTIRFKRYKSYSVGTQLAGTIFEYDCAGGTLIGSGASFSIQLSNGDIIIIDSMADLGYNIGLKIRNTPGDNNANVEVDTIYAISGVPSTLTLNNGALIIPVDYSFTGKSYDFYIGVDDGTYTSYKEVYFGQSDANDCDKEVYTFQSGAVDNKIGDYAQVYLGGSTNNALILSNNVFTDAYTVYNQIGGNSFNNHFLGYVSGNKIGSYFFGNTILGTFNNNIISHIFSDNLLGYFESNLFSHPFSNNISSLVTNFRNNTIKTSVSDIDFTLSTHVYAKYNCDIFYNQSEINRLSYYDTADVLTVDDIDA
jgi:hypothetical protein